MRILYVVHQFFPEFHTGTERVTLNLARMAQRAGHRVHVLSCALNPEGLGWRRADSLSGGWEGLWEGVPVVAIDRRALPAAVETSFDVSERSVNELQAWFHQQRFDVVHVMHSMRMASAVAAAQRAAIPIVVTATDFFLPCLRINLIDAEGRVCTGPDGGRRCVQGCGNAAWTPAALRGRWEHARAILASASVRAAPSPYVAARMQDAFPGLDFRVVAHGVDLRAIADAEPPEQPGAKPALRLAYVGSIVEAKGLHVLLEAMAKVPDASLRLIIAGRAHEAAYTHRIAQLADADPRVRPLGLLAAEEIAALMRATDLLCVPSLVPESFSLVLHEAAAAGVPALVSALGAPAEWVQAHGSGEALPPGAVDAWAQALRAVAEDPGRVAGWRESVPLPARIEEEAFFYENLYRSIRRAGAA
ncbi:glycosyl transferase, group 1 [Thioalkalivibrio nitratireducens DSM 14787]|uniref:Glycosyl transferase, group 1 n=1 Tax=Thioalkalivibrio nitratireducens (strain DSM 14787 / UNIQEM 213 / ALEN2) TaxID=1255043 RepID=L0DYZ5_THIND|nr:glycosyltransferase [Thioalkalivibrio nitratireducens]AGA33586.1 glycosyl transferase, group 1 [Thioalkalivibrio nitratireducens DSM 14787]